MTAMLASVTGPGEAEIAIAGGADIIDLKDPAAGSLGALPLSAIRDTLATVGGRRRTSAVAGDLPMQPDLVARTVAEIAATGVDFVKVGLFPGPDQTTVLSALGTPAAGSRLIAVLFADLEPDPDSLLEPIAASGFAGIMLDTADKAGGRLLSHKDVPALGRFVRGAHERGLMAGLAGSLEAPDVPRLLAVDPDFIGFRGALCAAQDRKSGIDPAAVSAIRRLIPQEPAASEAGNVDYRLLAARGYSPSAETDGAMQRIFVHDLVLPARIGAYSHEKDAPQRVRFNVTVDVQRSRGEPQGMGEVFSYDLITDGIRSLLADTHFELVETVAERIAALLLRHPRVRRVTIKVEKLDLGPGSVGVELTLDRADPAAQQNPVLAMLEDRGRKPRP